LAPHRTKKAEKRGSCCVKYNKIVQANNRGMAGNVVKNTIKNVFKSIAFLFCLC
jgi:hypothetical protein